MSSNCACCDNDMCACKTTGCNCCCGTKACSCDKTKCVCGDCCDTCCTTS